MRISGIVATPVSIPFDHPEWWAFGEHKGQSSIIIEMHTDSGIVGIGEAVPGGPGPETLLGAIRELTPLLEGRDPFSIESNLRYVLYAGGWYMFQRTGNLVLAGIEMAMWDIVGKALGQPVYQFFGGPVRARVDYVYYLQRDSPAPELAKRAQDAVENGFKTVWIKCGGDSEEDIDLISLLRDTLGPTVQLRVDANESWTAGSAVRMLRRLEPYDLEYAEQPVRMDDIEALAHVRRATRVPIGAHQSAWTGQRVLDVIRGNAADVIVTDPHQEGGLGAFRKVVGLCELAGLPVVHHAYSGLTIAMTASMHVLCTAPNCILGHQAYPPGFLIDDVTTTVMDVSTGSARIPDGPGLGVEIDPHKLKEAARRFERDGFYSFFDSAASPGWVPMK